MCCRIVPYLVLAAAVGLGCDESPGPVTYTVPEGGGTVGVVAKGGERYEFEFPASAAGRTVTLTPAGSSVPGWPDGQFANAIRMSPDGEQFSDPVIVRPENRSMILLHFRGSDSRATPVLLWPDPAREGLELRHFSTLAGFPGSSCKAPSIWDLAPACCPLDSMCPTASTLVSVTCTTGDGCLRVDVSCCTLPGETECRFPYSSLTATRVESEKERCSGDGGPDPCVSSFDCGTTKAECGTVTDNCGTAHDIMAECPGIVGCGARGTCGDDQRCGPCTPYGSCDEARAVGGRSCAGRLPDGCGGAMECAAEPCGEGEECFEDVSSPGSSSCRTPCAVDGDCPAFELACYDDHTRYIGGSWCESSTYCEGVMGIDPCRDEQGNPTACVGGVCQ